MPRELPSPKEVRDLLEDLLGRTVTVSPADPIPVADLPRTLVGLYVDGNLKLGAVVGMDFELTAYASAAIGLVPPGGAKACIDDKEISPMLGENAAEVCNILASLLNREGEAHLKLHQTFLPGQSAPVDAIAYLTALGRRLDQSVDIAGYGSGKLTMALAN